MRTEEEVWDQGGYEKTLVTGEEGETPAVDERKTNR